MADAARDAAFIYELNEWFDLSNLHLLRRPPMLHALPDCLLRSGLKAMIGRASFTLLVLLLAGAVHAQSGRTSAAPGSWVKLCDRGEVIKKKNNAKKTVESCLTFNERISANVGKQLGAYLLQCKVSYQHKVDEKQFFGVMVPTNVGGQANMRATLVPKDMWDERLDIETLEKDDGARLVHLTLKFMSCSPEGCPAEIEVTSNLLTSLKSSRGFIASATNESGALVTGHASLLGFASTVEGEPSQRTTPGLSRQWLEGLARRCVKLALPEVKQP